MDSGVLEVIRAPATPLYGMLLAVVVTIARAWPAIMGRVNERRKIEADAQSGLRGDLFHRIKELEETSERDRGRFEQAMADEKRRCDAELAQMRTDFGKRLDELMNIIIQNSKSTAQMIGRPGDAALSKTRERGEE